MFSIKTKLVFLIAICVFLTAVILGGIGLYKVTSVINQNSQHSLSLVGSAEKQRLNVILSNLEQSVKTLEAVVKSDITDVGRFIDDKDYRAQVTRELEYHAYDFASNTDVSVSCYMRYNPEVFGSKEGFYWLKSTSSQDFMPEECIDILMYDSNDSSHVGWYYIPVRQNSPTWLTPYWNDNIKIYVISYVIPVYIKNTLMGVVGMDIDFSHIMREINDINPYTNGYAYLLNRDGSVMYYKNSEQESVTEKSNVVEEKNFILYNGWNLVVAVPKKDIDDEKMQIIPFMIIATLIVGLIFIVIAVYSVSNFINPILELNEVAKKIAAGNMDVDIRTNPKNDEIGIFARNFREAVLTLPSYIYKDALTGIKNVAAYKKAVSDNDAKIASGEMCDFGVIVFDVNNLKTTNDRYGHEAGNSLIITASKFICNIFKSSPVYRIGGDEFVTLLYRKDYENREALIRQFDQEMSEQKISVPGNTLTLSIARGLAVYDSSSKDTYASMFKRADDAMYENKQKVKGLA